MISNQSFSLNVMDALKYPCTTQDKASFADINYTGRLKIYSNFLNNLAPAASGYASEGVS
jgi:hypothetical protein